MALTQAQRIKRRRSFLKAKSKIARGRERSKRKLASAETLQKRAKKAARREIEKKLAQGKDKSEMSFAQRQSLENKVNKRKGAIERKAKKLLKVVRKKDREKLKR